MWDIINKGLQRVQQVIKGFLLHQFYYNQVTVTDTRNLLEYYLKPFKQSIQSKQKATPSAARTYK
jgi:beta-glucosidase-like glycosyl hydrolase